MEELSTVIRVAPPLIYSTQKPTPNHMIQLKIPMYSE